MAKDVREMMKEYEENVAETAENHRMIAESNGQVTSLDEETDTLRDELASLRKKRVELLGIGVPVIPPKKSTADIENALLVATTWGSFQQYGSTVGEAKAKVNEALEFKDALCNFGSSKEILKQLEDIQIYRPYHDNLHSLGTPTAIKKLLHGTSKKISDMEKKFSDHENVVRGYMEDITNLKREHATEKDKIIAERDAVIAKVTSMESEKLSAQETLLAIISDLEDELSQRCAGPVQSGLGPILILKT
jgi:DNA repair exonuclease SbcCD ATPase subunit